jgi:hyperosmotically inducible periplasmic protein
MKSTILLSTLVAGLVLLSAGMSMSATDMDNRIVSSVMETYVFKVYLQDEHINIVSMNGVVTLTGTINDELKKALAQETVAGLPDVKRVDNRLEVKGPTPPAFSDVWIHDKMKFTLMFHRGVNAGKTEIEVKDGMVTLRGVVDSQAQKELTGAYANNVQGVKNVKNDLTVSTGSKKINPEIESVDDASITAQVKVALLSHRSTSAIGTSVTTDQGMVTLYGKVKNKTEFDLATQLASDINGVKAVHNKMVIE